MRRQELIDYIEENCRDIRTEMLKSKEAVPKYFLSNLNSIKQMGERIPKNRIDWVIATENKILERIRKPDHEIYFPIIRLASRLRVNLEEISKLSQDYQSVVDLVDTIRVHAQYHLFDREARNREASSPHNRLKHD